MSGEPAEVGPEQARPRADAELRDQVVSLLSDWNLQDPNPEAYTRILDQLASTENDTEPATGQLRATDSGTASLRVVLMSLESGVFGPLVEKALDRVVADGEASTVHTHLRSRPEGSDDVADAILSTLAQPAMLSTFVASEEFDFNDLDPLVPYLSVAGFEVLLDRLATTTVRATRRRLLDMLSGTVLDLSDAIVARLEDDRWYVKRNLLVLLDRHGCVPTGFSASPWTSDPDSRVRLEAIRVQLRLPDEYELALLTALEDVDSRVVALGLTGSRSLSARGGPSYR